MEVKSLQELFEFSKQKLERQYGNISITFADLSYVYKGNDVIGNCLQEWILSWFKSIGIDVKHWEDTQLFPDFVVQFGTQVYDMEIKAWNINNSPAFDLANFHSFIETTYNTPEKLNAKYFILGYTPKEDGFVVEKIFLKNIWEITSSTSKYPIGLQVKRNMPYAIRPYNFNSNPNGSFATKLDFILAVKETFELFPNSTLKFTPNEWFDKVSKY